MHGRSPFHYDVYSGIPVNQNVTIYSDDSCMGVLASPQSRHLGYTSQSNCSIYSNDSCKGLLIIITSCRRFQSIKMLLYIAMTHACTFIYIMTSYNMYLSIKMLLYIAMIHAWAYPLHYDVI